MPLFPSAIIGLRYCLVEQTICRGTFKAKLKKAAMKIIRKWVKYIHSERRRRHLVSIKKNETVIPHYAEPVLCRNMININFQIHTSI